MPYGTQGTPLTESDRRRAFARELIVLVGELDTETTDIDDSLRSTDEAMAQGQSRFERAAFYIDTADAASQALGTTLAWVHDVAPGASHDTDEMAASAAWYLFRAEAETPCTPTLASAADALVFTEVLADPPEKEAGDANGDGERDSADDEFVEIVNTGSTSVCLGGWILGDASNPERHRFPLGSQLEAGQALVVFGGGIPTGSFGGAGVQWAAFGGQLSLQSGGDVLTLSDESAETVLQFSWGDCDDAPCAADHFEDDLGNEQSLTRPTPDGDWVDHSSVSTGLYSPGTHVDGSAF